jgi:predicted nucleic acid-binding protein
MPSVTTNDRILITAADIPDEALARDVLFDTNVWLRVHGCLTDIADRATVIYSAYYKKVLDEGRKIFLPQVVVSEFVNVSLSMKASEAGWMRTQGKRHQHADYCQWINDISDDLYHITTDCIPVDDAFASIDLSEALTTCGSAKLDFNDVLISMTCSRLGIFLVTDDADFASQPIPIVTGNKRLATGGR